jgi:hypothetical protein
MQDMLRRQGHLLFVLTSEVPSVMAVPRNQIALHMESLTRSWAAGLLFWSLIFVNDHRLTFLTIVFKLLR